MDADGEPLRFCDEGDMRTRGSFGYPSQAIGFSEFIRHPFRNQRSLDKQVSYPAANNDTNEFLTLGLRRNCSSFSSRSLDNVNQWPLQHVEVDSNASKMGRSSTWSSLITGAQFDKHPDGVHRLSIVPEVAAEPVHTVPMVASQPVLYSSKSFRILPDALSLSKASGTSDSMPRIDEKKRELCHETRGAIVFSARPINGNCELHSSFGKDADHHSIFGLPSRIQVTKRELNMMTPSSFWPRSHHDLKYCVLSTPKCKNLKWILVITVFILVSLIFFANLLLLLL